MSENKVDAKESVELSGFIKELSYPRTDWDLGRLSVAGMYGVFEGLKANQYIRELFSKGTLKTTGSTEVSKNIIKAQKTGFRGCYVGRICNIALEEEKFYLVNVDCVGFDPYKDGNIVKANQSCLGLVANAVSMPFSGVSCKNIPEARILEGLTVIFTADINEEDGSFTNVSFDEIGVAMYDDNNVPELLADTVPLDFRNIEKMSILGGQLRKNTYRNQEFDFYTDRYVESAFSDQSILVDGISYLLKSYYAPFKESQRTAHELLRKMYLEGEG
jgi:hypothetical protein